MAAFLFVYVPESITPVEFYICTILFPLLIYLPETLTS